RNGGCKAGSQTNRRRLLRPASEPSLPFGVAGNWCKVRHGSLSMARQQGRASMARTLMIAAASAAVVMLSQTAFAQGQSGAADEAKATFIVTDMYTGPDGLTHLRNKAMKLGELEKAAAIVIGRVAANPAFSSDWHNAPQRRYVVPLSGRFEVEVSSDGTIKS